MIALLVIINNDCTHSLLLDLLIGYNQRTNADIWVKFRLLYSNFQALEIYVQANFSSKRVCRCLHMHKASERKINGDDNFSIKRACRCLHIHTASVRKINEVNLIASCVLGHPKCFRRPKTTYRHPTLQSRADMQLLHCKDIRFTYKFYAPNNHINYPNVHSWIIKITNYLIKKLAAKDAVYRISY